MRTNIAVLCTLDYNFISMAKGTSASPLKSECQCFPPDPPDPTQEVDEAMWPTERPRWDFEDDDDDEEEVIVDNIEVETLDIPGPGHPLLERSSSAAAPSTPTLGLSKGAKLFDRRLSLRHGKHLNQLPRSTPINFFSPVANNPGNYQVC